MMEQLGLNNNGEWSSNTGLKGEKAWGEDTVSTQLQTERQEAKRMNTQILLCQRLPLIELKWKPKGHILLYTEKVREG